MSDPVEGRDGEGPDGFRKNGRLRVVWLWKGLSEVDLFYEKDNGNDGPRTYTKTKYNINYQTFRKG